MSLIILLKNTVVFYLIFAHYFFCDGCETENIEENESESESSVWDLLADTEHELVEIEFLEPMQKRSTDSSRQNTKRGIRIRAFSKIIELWLQPKDSVLLTENTKIFFSQYNPTEPGNVKIRRLPQIMHTIGQVLEDPAHLASLVIGKDKYGRKTLHGHIGKKNLGIIPLSKPSCDCLDNETIERAPKNRTYHAVYKTSPNNPDDISSPFPNDMVISQSIGGRAGTPDTLYPEILAAVDFSVYRNHRGGLIRFIEYLMAFFNGVDLKYRILEKPHFRLHISAILISKGRKGLPYMYHNYVGYDNVDYEAAVDDSAQFFYNVKEAIPLHTYDVAFTLTRNRYKLKDNTVIGTSFTGAVCRNYTNYELMVSSAVIHDNGVFSGIFTAAHELGHIIGMYHDRNQNHPCSSHKGYIMSMSPQFNKYSVYFSNCSLQEIRTELNHGSLTCLYNAPDDGGRSLPLLTPGKYVSGFIQCRALGYKKACNIGSAEFCLHLYCQARNGTCLSINEMTLDGTKCSARYKQRRWCMHGRCVPVPTT